MRQFIVPYIMSVDDDTNITFKPLVSSGSHQDIIFMGDDFHEALDGITLELQSDPDSHLFNKTTEEVSDILSSRYSLKDGKKMMVEEITYEFTMDQNGKLEMKDFSIQTPCPLLHDDNYKQLIAGFYNIDMNDSEALHQKVFESMSLDGQIDFLAKLVSSISPVLNDKRREQNSSPTSIQENISRSTTVKISTEEIIASYNEIKEFLQPPSSLVKNKEVQLNVYKSEFKILSELSQLPSCVDHFIEKNDIPQSSSSRSYAKK